jgi:hypothetical protein
MPRRPAGSPFKTAPPVPVEVFEVGDRVTHDRCGLGRVVNVEGDSAVHVEFASQTVRVVAPFAGMTKL